MHIAMKIQSLTHIFSRSTGQDYRDVYQHTGLNSHPKHDFKTRRSLCFNIRNKRGVTGSANGIAPLSWNGGFPKSVAHILSTTQTAALTIPQGKWPNTQHQLCVNINIFYGGNSMKHLLLLHSINYSFRLQFSM